MVCGRGAPNDNALLTLTWPVWQTGLIHRRLGSVLLQPDLSGAGQVWPASVEYRGPGPDCLWPCSGNAAQTQCGRAEKRKMDVTHVPEYLYERESFHFSCVFLTHFIWISWGYVATLFDELKHVLSAGSETTACEVHAAAAQNQRRTQRVLQQLHTTQRHILHTRINTGINNSRIKN